MCTITASQWDKFYEGKDHILGIFFFCGSEDDTQSVWYARQALCYQVTFIPFGVCARVCAHACVSLCVSMWVSVHLCLSVCLYVCISLCLCVYLSLFVCVCLCVPDLLNKITGIYSITNKFFKKFKTKLVFRILLDFQKYYEARTENSCLFCTVFPFTNILH